MQTLEASNSTLYEDDGRTLNYDANGRPVYHFRTTEIGQQRVDNLVTVTILPALNVNSTSPFTGAVNSRQNVVKLAVENAEAAEVTLNGTPLVRQTSESTFNAASSGWFNAGNNLILAKSQPLDVYKTTKIFSFRVQPISQTTSVNFVCDKGFTTPGESIYVVGNIPALGGPNWNTDRAVKLDPSIYYEYIVSPPAGNNGPGPFAPVWTGIISGIPSNITFEWKCLLKKDDGTGEVKWQPGSNNTFTTTSSGYAGRSYGSF